MTQEYLISILNYDPETGVFVWRVNKSYSVKTGSVAGAGVGHGYRRIMLDGKRYHAHRLAWLYVNGVWPTDQIDHINGDRGDNRIINLREASRSQNGQNQRKPMANNKIGLLGVSFDKLAGKFTAKIRIDGKQRHLGLFVDANDAHNAYLVAKRELHKFCTI